MRSTRSALALQTAAVRRGNGLVIARVCRAVRHGYVPPPYNRHSLYAFSVHVVNSAYVPLGGAR